MASLFKDNFTASKGDQRLFKISKPSPIKGIGKMGRPGSLVAKHSHIVPSAIEPH